jgi:hypothetical protein
MRRNPSVSSLMQITVRPDDYRKVYSRAGGPAGRVAAEKYCYDHNLSRGHRNAWNLQVRPVTIRTAVHAAPVMLTGMAQ